MICSHVSSDRNSLFPVKFWMHQEECEFENNRFRGGEAIGPAPIGVVCLKRTVEQPSFRSQGWHGGFTQGFARVHSPDVEKCLHIWRIRPGGFCNMPSPCAVAVVTEVKLAARRGLQAEQMTRKHTKEFLPTSRLIVQNSRTLLLLSRSRHKYYKYPSPQTDHQDYWQKILHRKSSTCCSLPSLNNLTVLQWHPPRHGQGSRAKGLGQKVTWDAGS
jgi:hypothetical protein